VHRRPVVVFEALAQSNQLRLVGEESDIIVGNLIGEDRLEAAWRRDVVAGRPCAGPDLLLRLQEPSEKELRRVRMRRVLEERPGKGPDRYRIEGRECEPTGLPAFFSGSVMLKMRRVIPA